MALDSTTTFALAKAQYQNNADWDGDIAKILLALEAVRHLKVLAPKSATMGNVQFSSYDWGAEERALQEAKEAYYTANRSRFVRGRIR